MKLMMAGVPRSVSEFQTKLSQVQKQRIALFCVFFLDVCCCLYISSRISTAPFRLRILLKSEEASDLENPANVYGF